MSHYKEKGGFLFNCYLINKTLDHLFCFPASLIFFFFWTWTFKYVTAYPTILPKFNDFERLSTLP